MLLVFTDILSRKQKNLQLTYQGISFGGREKYASISSFDGSFTGLTTLKPKKGASVNHQSDFGI